MPGKSPIEEEPMPLSASEASIEAELKLKGLNAPRLTPALIDAVIVSEAYHVFPGTTLTICALTLRNGFIVTGESAAASPENFDEAIGRRIARDNARGKIWALEGYLLRQRLSGVTETKTVAFKDVKPILEARKRGEITDDEVVEEIFKIAT
jgi:exopolyphosphatase/pppGpp-phosphohydrolase